LRSYGDHLQQLDSQLVHYPLTIVEDLSRTGQSVRVPLGKLVRITSADKTSVCNSTPDGAMPLNIQLYIHCPGTEHLSPPRVQTQ